VRYIVKDAPKDLNADQQEAFNMLVSKMNELSDLLDVREEKVRTLGDIIANMEKTLTRERNDYKHLDKQKVEADKKAEKVAKLLTDFIKTSNM